MRKIVAVSIVCVVFSFVSAFAEELPWRAFFPYLGEADFGSVRTQIISSPFGQREGVCPRDEADGRKKCEDIFSRKWLHIIPSKQPRIQIFVTDISRPSSYVPDYSLFVSRLAQYDRSGGLFIAGKRISFSYYTINADAAEAVNIEKHRAWLDAMARQKKKVRLSGKITRIETSDLALLEEGTTQTEFLDFYLSDIRFEK